MPALLLQVPPVELQAYPAALGLPCQDLLQLFDSSYSTHDRLEDRGRRKLWISKKELDDDEELSHNENVATVEAMMFEISSISLHVVLQIVTLVQQKATVVTGGSEISSMMCPHMTEFDGFTLTESCGGGWRFRDLKHVTSCGASVFRSG